MLNELFEYQEAVLSKLTKLEKKFTLLLKSASDSTKLVEINTNRQTIIQAIKELQNGTLTWAKLHELGISKSSIIKEQEQIDYDESLVSFEDLPYLSRIPRLMLVEELGASATINHLYSIVSFLENNYQAIFTQKILLMSSKTTGLRDQFYTRLQDIYHICRSYQQFFGTNRNSGIYNTGSFEKKEYLLLIRKIYDFLSGVEDYVHLIQTDETFIPEDFRKPIISVDKNISIYNIPLGDALGECKQFINQALTYFKDAERDFYDALQLEK